MLRINLLPIRQLQKRAKATNQIVSVCIALGCILLILAAVGLFKVKEINATNESIAALKAEEQSFAETLKNIETLKNNTAELERRIDVINTLRTDSSLTVHVLDEITKRIDFDRVWLTSLNQQGNNLSLDGVALDNETIAQFMDALKSSPYIDTVALGQSTLRGISGNNLKSFQLTCTVSQADDTKEEAEETTQAE